MCWDGTGAAKWCAMAIGNKIGHCISFSKEMLATVSLITMATVWHDDPIRLCAQPPTTAQIWCYVAGRDRFPSGAPVLTHRGLIPSPSPSEGGI